MPHDPFQIHAGPRLTGPQTLGLGHYSNFTGIDTHRASPNQKLLNRCCDTGRRWGEVGGQRLRRETAGNRRRWGRHCKQGVNLQDRQTYCSGAAFLDFFLLWPVYPPLENTSPFPVPFAIIICFEYFNGAKIQSRRETSILFFSCQARQTSELCRQAFSVLLNSPTNSASEDASEIDVHRP